MAPGKAARSPSEAQNTSINEIFGLKRPSFQNLCLQSTWGRRSLAEAPWALDEGQGNPKSGCESHNARCSLHGQGGRCFKPRPDSACQAFANPCRKSGPWGIPRGQNILQGSRHMHLGKSRLPPSGSPAPSSCLLYPKAHRSRFYATITTLAFVQSWERCRLPPHGLCRRRGSVHL